MNEEVVEKTKDGILKEALDKYGEMKYQIDGLESSRKTAIDKILEKYPEVKKEIDEIDEEIGLQIKNAQLAEKKFRKKLDVLIDEYGETAPIKDILDFKSDSMKLRYTKKITYDSAALDGIALKDPTILAFRKEEMSTRLEVIKK